MQAESKNTRTIRILTTPQELRAMADQMEREWSTSANGDSIITRTLVLNNGDVIHFIIDQVVLHQRG